MPDLVLTERHDGGVALLRLNRPPMNPLSIALLGELRDAALALAVDADVKAVVVAGSEKALAAGADVGELRDQAGARAVADAFRAAFDAVGAIPRPVIAAVRGYALGGGLELALACDLRVGAENARVGQPEVLLGALPGAGGSQRLARLIGPVRAKELCWYELGQIGHLFTSLPWGVSEFQAAKSLMGDDYWSYGLAPNRQLLETFTRYHHEQGISARPVEPEELFAPSTLDLSRI